MYYAEVCNESVGSSPRHCACVQHSFFLKECSSDDEPLATLRSILPARDLNLGPPVAETNALPLDQLAYLVSNRLDGSFCKLSGTEFHVLTP